MAENTIIHEISLAGYKATSTGGMLDLGTWGSYGIEMATHSRLSYRESAEYDDGAHHRRKRHLSVQRR